MSASDTQASHNEEKYTLCPKKITILSYYNCDENKSILTVFGTVLLRKEAIKNYA